MKIFDYKFLILLGLSLVVYFIYREVEYIRSKVDKLEKEFKSENLLPDKLTNTNNILTDTHQEELKILTIKPVLALPKPPGIDKQLEVINISQLQFQHQPNFINDDKEQNKLNKISPKIITVDLSPSKANEQTSFESGVKLTKIVNKQKSHSDSEYESCSDSSSSKHLAIYSNDNDQYEETQNSLLESIESNKLELNFDYDDKIPNLNTNVDDIINMVTSENNSDIKNKTIDALDNSSNSEVVESDGISFSNDKHSSSSDKMSEQELEKKKLPEIKKIAESKKISLTKKINGQQKPKNKPELINEIIGQKKASIDKVDK